MNLNELSEWKKVLESDLEYLAIEIKETVGDRALIILDGEVGAGKTTFVKEFLKGEATQSPSYNILTETRSALHADFYRIEKTEEIMYLELELYLSEKKYFLVEWGKKFIHTLSREVPEAFDFYFLEIKMHENPEFRNFKLSEIEL